MTANSRRTWLGIALGLTVSAIFLWLALRQINFEELINALKSANYGFVILSSFGLAGGLALRSLRWRIIAGASLEQQSHFYQATNIGAFSNMILPARAGEFVRIFVLARLTNVRMVKPLTSALLDRLMDVIVIPLSAVALYFLLPRNPQLDQWLGTIIGVGLIISGAVLAAIKMIGVGQNWLSRRTDQWLKGWKVRPDALFAELNAEAKRLLGSWISAKLVLVVIAILLVDCIAVGGQILAFHLDVPLMATLLLWVFLVIGTMLPSAPGYIGVYQTAAIWALSFFSVPPSSAVALAVVLQATTFVVTFILAGPGFWTFVKSALAAKRGDNA